MKITLLVSDDCPACKRVLSSLSELKLNGRKLSFAVTNIAEAKLNPVPIVPALFVDDKLFCYGDVNTAKLAEYIASL